MTVLIDRSSSGVLQATRCVCAISQVSAWRSGSVLKKLGADWSQSFDGETSLTARCCVDYRDTLVMLGRLYADGRRLLPEAIGHSIAGGRRPLAGIMSGTVGRLCLTCGFCPAFAGH